MNNTLTICFYGSSDYELQEKLADLYKTEIDIVIDKVLSIQSSNIKIITGGYGGIMDLIAEKIQHQKSSYNQKNIEVIGITCDAYDFENPTATKYNSSNDYSKHNDVIIQAKNFADRIQAMIELSDLFIVLPGKQGSLSELLLTCESYAFGKYILNDKKAKLFVHDYWRALLSNEIVNHKTNISYFRDFDANVLEYFNKENIEAKLSSLNVDPKFNNLEEIPKHTLSAVQSIKEEDFIQYKFQELKNHINKTILGRLVDGDGKEVLKRLNLSDNSILGLDFGWFLTSKEMPKSGNYYTFSTDEYVELTTEFFTSHNSIMLNDDEYKIPFKETFLNGKHQTQTHIEFREGESIPKENRDKNKGFFASLKSHFEKYQYGQTLIWRGFKITDNGFVKQIYQEKANEIIFSVFLLLNHRIPIRKVEKIRQIIDDFLLMVSSTKAAELFQEKENAVEQAAIRAAISQVMARNTSHNIGAHVMNKLTNPDFLEKFCSYANCLKSYKPDTDFVDFFEHRPSSQLAIFNNYLKCRMDYLADIALGTPVMQTNKYVYQDLFKELDKVRLLLEHISGLPDFEYKIEFKRNGKRFKASKRNKEDNEAVEDDLLVAIPNDILGAQAFYNILENIIRNTAKHSKKNVDEKGKTQLTIFTVNFIDTNTATDLKSSENNQEIEMILNEMVAVEIYDNIDVKGDEYILSDGDKTEYKAKMGKDAPNKFSAIEGLVFSQNKNLNEDILKDNKLRSGSLGLVEMDASATYLRKRDVSYINHPNYDLTYDEYWSSYSKASQKDKSKRGTDCRNFLKAFIKYDDKGSHLGYRFFLLRPAVALVVIESLEFDETKITELKKNGIWIITKDIFKEELQGKKEGGKVVKAGKVYNHEFVLFTDENDGEIKTLISAYKASLPTRVLYLDNTELNEIISDTPEDKEDISLLIAFQEFCWHKWFEKLKTQNPCKTHNCTHRNFHIIYNSVKDACHNIILLNHLYSEEGVVKSEVEVQKEWGRHKIYNYYVEALSSLAQSKMPNFYTLTKNCEKVSTEKFKYYIDSLDKCTQQQIAEGAFSKIIVFDERIQEAAENRNFMSVLFKELYHRMNVIVPDKKELDLSEISFEKIKSSAENFIKKHVKDARETDFILIHYSILERMYKKTEIDTELRKLIGDSKINAVITSGRGIPDNLSQNLRFVNLSSVTTAFIDVRSKFAINYLLNSSRKSNKL